MGSLPQTDNTLTFENVFEEKFIQDIVADVKLRMRDFDASHSYTHIERVLALARKIYNDSPPSFTAHLDIKTITLGALLHDVNDRKYVKSEHEMATMIAEILITHGASRSYAEKIQTICLGVSYTSEKANPAACAALIKMYPELAIVQDADRLDALGASGIARCFTYGGAKTQRPMQDSVDHFAEKLYRLPGMMKTDVGRMMGAARVERLRIYEDWWRREMEDAKLLL